MVIQRGESQKTLDSATAFKTLSESHDDNYDLVSPYESVRAITPVLKSYTSSSTAEEARASVEQLTTLVRKVLENNQDISQRMTRLEAQTLGYSLTTDPTMSTSCETPVAIRAHNNPNGDVASCLTIERASVGSQAMISGRQPPFSFSFDDDLNKSRAYTKAMRRSLIWSPRSSAIGTIGWSCLSGLSLADVSEISVINLPVSPCELWNGERYSTSHMEINNVLETIIMELSRTGSESISAVKSGQSSEPRVGNISHLRSVSATSYHDSAKSKSISFKLVKRLLSETLVPEGRRTPGIGIGDNNIPIATLPRKILLLGMFQLPRGPTAQAASCAYNTVLGASLSGKTTIYNHLQILYGKGFSKADRWDARQWLVNYLIDAFKTAKEDMVFIQTDHGTEMEDAEVCNNKAILVHPVIKCLHSACRRISNY